MSLSALSQKLHVPDATFIQRMEQDFTSRALHTRSKVTHLIHGLSWCADNPVGEVIPGEGNDFLEPSTFFDPLGDANACTRDAPVLKDLGVNTIRVYSVNSSLNHDGCMKSFSDAGIYTM